jgi:ribosomal protein L27
MSSCSAQTAGRRRQQQQARERGVSGAEGAAGQRQDAAKLMRVLALVVRMRGLAEHPGLGVGLARDGCVGVARDGCTDWIDFSSVGQVRQAIQIAGAGGAQGRIAFGRMGAQGLYSCAIATTMMPAAAQRKGTCNCR